MRVHPKPPTLARLSAEPSTDIKVVLPKNWNLTDRKVISYQDCPRRFFYTHVLGIGTARRSTPFQQTHSCIYELISWLSNARLCGAPTREETHNAFEDIWKHKGPTDPAFIADYHDLARRLVDGLVDAGAGRIFREAKPLAIDFKNGCVIVEPSEIAERAGVVVVRRIRSGHRGEKEFDKLEYYFYQTAAAKHFGINAMVEAIHLTDSEVVDVPGLTRQKLTGREKKAEELLAGIKSGAFYPERDQFSCPRCPHFFICAATPDGDLVLG